MAGFSRVAQAPSLARVRRRPSRRQRAIGDPPGTRGHACVLAAASGSSPADISQRIGREERGWLLPDAWPRFGPEEARPAAKQLPGACRTDQPMAGVMCSTAVVGWAPSDQPADASGFWSAEPTGPWRQ